MTKRLEEEGGTKGEKKKKKDRTRADKNWSLIPYHVKKKRGKTSSYQGDIGPNMDLTAATNWSNQKPPGIGR